MSTVLPSTSATNKPPRGPFAYHIGGDPPCTPNRIPSPPRDPSRGGSVCVSHHEPPPRRTRPRRRTGWPDDTAAGRATTPPGDSDEHHHGHVLPPGHLAWMKSCHDSKLGSHVSPRGNILRRGCRRPTPSPRLVGPRVACTDEPCGGRTGWPTRGCPPRGGNPTNGSTSVAYRRLRPHARRRPLRRTLCPCVGAPRGRPHLRVPRGSAGVSAGPLVAPARPSRGRCSPSQGSRRCPTRTCPPRGPAPCRVRLRGSRAYT